LAFAGFSERAVEGCDLFDGGAAAAGEDDDRVAGLNSAAGDAAGEASKAVAGPGGVAAGMRALI